MSINTDPYTTQIEALSQSDLKVRKAAIKALSELVDRRTIPTLIYLLEAKELPIRIEAMKALGKLKDARAIEPLIRILQTDSSGMAWCVPSVLARFADPRVTSALLQALNSPDTYVRQAAALACGRLREFRAVPRLIAMVEEISEFGPSFDRKRDSGLLDASWAAMEALGKIKDPQAIPVLIRALDDGFLLWRAEPWSYEGYCSAIADRLAQFGSAAIPFLLEALATDSVLVRYGAVMALTRLACWEAVPTVMTMLQDNDSLIFSAAVIYLGRSGNPQAIPFLVERIDERIDETTSFIVPFLLEVGEVGRTALLEYIQNGRARNNTQMYIDIAHWMVMGEKDARFVAVFKAGLHSEVKRIREVTADTLSRLLMNNSRLHYRRF